jgi:hypothetical protein
MLICCNFSAVRLKRRTRCSRVPTVLAVVFRREDGSFGFESFRRDPEGGGRWFAIGNFGEETFEDREAAVLSARRRVSWFDELT